MKTDIHLWSYLARFFLEWHVSDKFVEEIKTHFMLSNYFSETFTVYEIM